MDHKADNAGGSDDDGYASSASLRESCDSSNDFNLPASTILTKVYDRIDRINSLEKRFGDIATAQQQTNELLGLGMVIFAKSLLGNAR